MKLYVFVVKHIYVLLFVRGSLNKGHYISIVTIRTRMGSMKVVDTIVLFVSTVTTGCSVPAIAMFVRA